MFGKQKRVRNAYFRRMLSKVRSFEPSSAGFSEAGAVGGVEVEFKDTVELAAEGTGDTRKSVEPDDAEAMSGQPGRRDGE